MRFLGQRKSTLLRTAQQQLESVYLHQFPLPPQNHEDDSGGSQVYVMHTVSLHCKEGMLSVLYTDFIMNQERLYSVSGEGRSQLYPLRLLSAGPRPRNGPRKENSDLAFLVYPARTEMLRAHGRQPLLCQQCLPSSPAAPHSPGFLVTSLGTRVLCLFSCSAPV